ncbi:MAG: hypothetical protein K6T86_20375, partial [Pirellulales bacterium]|nr:hypothetical protein [Pirellulales bacterium]
TTAAGGETLDLLPRDEVVRPGNRPEEQVGQLCSRWLQFTGFLSFASLSARAYGWALVATFDILQLLTGKPDVQKKGQ